MSFAPICVPCAREMRCKRNGYFFADYENAALWSGDMYECPNCARQVVVGVGRDPVIEDYQPNFKTVREKHSHFTLDR